MRHKNCYDTKVNLVLRLVYYKGTSSDIELVVGAHLSLKLALGGSRSSMAGFPYSNQPNPTQFFLLKLSGQQYTCESE